MECHFCVFLAKFKYVILGDVFHSPLLSEEARNLEKVFQKILQKKRFAAREQFRPQVAMEPRSLLTSAPGARSLVLTLM